MPNISRKPRVGVDVDGVLADLLAPLFLHMNAMLGTAYAADHMKDWDITELVPPELRDEFWNTFGREVRVHDALKPLPGAIEGMSATSDSSSSARPRMASVARRLAFVSTFISPMIGSAAGSVATAVSVRPL
jgi:hypothetical protein